MWRVCRRKKWRGTSTVPRPRCGRTSPMRAPSFVSTWRKGSGKQMKHPNEAKLALHAGGDLGPIARWRTQRHLASCPECREEIARFGQLRQLLPSLDDSPELHCNRLAAEMRANIRLGLAAGECVRADERAGAGSMWSSARVGVALASVALLLATGVV